MGQPANENLTNEEQKPQDTEELPQSLGSTTDPDAEKEVEKDDEE